MSNIVRSALIAVALLSSASAAMAQSRDTYRTHQNYGNSSTDSARAFWDEQQRNGN
jgi:hypothetical protein